MTEPKKPTPQKESKCGHVNMHAIGEDGKLLKPKCTKAKGHDGLHSDGTHLWHESAGEALA